MPRSRSIVIDDEQGWIIREELVLDPASPTPPEQDYFVVQTGFPVWTSATTSYSQVVIWGVGLVSFGPVTPEQIAFMANLGPNPDLSLFPGDYVAFAFSSQQLFSYQYGLKQGFFYTGFSSGAPSITMTEDGFTVFSDGGGGYFGFDYGGLQGTATSILAPVTLYFSDLDVTSGTGGADTMVGEEGPETLLGLGGNDHLIGNGGSDRLEGGEGRDLLEGGLGNDRMWGGTGNDTLLGGLGNDRLFGDAGNDILDPGRGFDEVDGGAGVDRLVLDYADSATSIFFQFASGAFISTPGGGSVKAVNVEAMTVHGSQYSDVLNGTAYADELYGGDGYDLIRGGAGNDLLDSGANSAAPIAVLPRAGDTIDTALPIDHFFSLSADPNIFDSATVPHASLKVDVQTRDAEFDQETKRYVAITVAAGATLTIDVDNAFFSVDTRLAILDANGNIIASNDDGPSLDPGSVNSQDSLLSFTFAAAGTYYVEITSFIAASNQQSSFNVHFSLTSAEVPTHDVLIGGTGNDTYVVHSVNDEVIEQAAGGTDTIRSDVSFVLPANVEKLVLTGTAPIDGTGNALANSLIGNEGKNVLRGEGGNDTLNGGLGNDVLYGGNGADRYLFDTALDGVANFDLLADWNAAQDTIVLDRTIFSQLSLGGLSNARFYAGSAAHDADDRIIYDSATGRISYDADGNGPGAAVLFALVAPGSTVTASDFLVVA